MHKMAASHIIRKMGIESNMTREDEDPGVPQPPAYAAGWAAATTMAEVPLEAMNIAPETPSAAPPVGTPSVDVGMPDSTGYGDRFDIGPSPGATPSAPVIASALLNQPQQDGLKYLFNYASKSIRRNRGVSEQDRDDLLHDIYMEWWICTGFEVASLPKLLETDSTERQSLRESIYRVFGRYRYHQTAHRTGDLENDELLAIHDPQGTRDFSLDLKNWLATLPNLEAKIIDLYYFQHKTMDEIGAEMGLAKQRVSEIHKRAIAKHPDAKDLLE